MKKRIYFNIAIISILVAIFTSAFLIFTFYNFYLEQEKQSLKDSLNILSNSLEFLDNKDYESILNNEDINFRTTVIDFNGKVMYDSNQDIDKMGNHIDRLEIKEAIIKGTGESVRYSSTIGKDTYYYAVKLSNGYVLRVSRQMDNILSVFIKILPTIFLIILLILFFLLFISSLFTKKILKPVEEVSDNIEKIISGKEVGDLKVYDELTPFVKILIKQSKEINLNIKNLKEKADTMDAITSNMKEGIILLDNKKHILSLNNSGISLLNDNENNSYNEKIFLTLCRNIEVNKIIDNALNIGESNEITIKSMDKYVDIYVNPVFSSEHIIGAVLFVVDSTEKHRSELMRREFSANVSHELKTPLTSINGYAEMIENGMAEGDHIIKFASIIRKEGTRLLELIDSIISLSKLDEYNGNKNFNPIDIYKISMDTINTFEIIAKEKNIDIELNGETLIINANKSMVEELLFNIIDNAIKYSNLDGRIVVNVEKDSEYAIITVLDNGVGIPEEYQSRVFERFYMIDKSRSRENKSTGLGLSIVKHIVEYHNGIINLTSEYGKGTKVQIKLPVVL